MNFYCAICDMELRVEELVADEEGNDICCPYCQTAIPELDPSNIDTKEEGK